MKDVPLIAAWIDGEWIYLPPPEMISNLPIYRCKAPAPDQEFDEIILPEFDGDPMRYPMPEYLKPQIPSMRTEIKGAPAWIFWVSIIGLIGWLFFMGIGYSTGLIR